MRLFVDLASMGDHDHVDAANGVFDALDDAPVANAVTQITFPFAFQALGAATRILFQVTETTCEFQGQRPIRRCIESRGRWRQIDLKHRF